MAIGQRFEFAQSEELISALAQAIADQLRAGIAARGRASLALSGGRTPIPLFQALAQQALDWSCVDATLVDDRWVPLDHADSNEALVRQHLLQGPAAAIRWFGLYSGTATALESVPAISERLNALTWPLDVVVLGMGDDGHTASWFPQSPELAEAVDLGTTARWAATHPVTAPHERITLTLPQVLAARSCYLHIAGPKKAEVLAQALGAGPMAEMPIRYVLRAEGVSIDVYWSK